MYIVVYLMFSHSHGQVSYILLYGSVLRFVQASIHPPCTAQPILQPRVKKTRVQEIHQVSTAYTMAYTMRIMLYEEIYHPLLRIRLEPSCEPV